MAKMEDQSEANNLDMTDKVVKNIFTSCDGANNDAVPVSELIRFIKPFMEENMSELEELKNMLDPDNINPCVSSEQFYKAMTEWTGKLKDDGGFTDNTFQEMNQEMNHNGSFNHVNGKDLNFLQSTPRASLGDHLLKGYGHAMNLNISNVSAYSLTDCNVPLTLDASCLEEKVKELEHQLNRANMENELLRQQVVAVEEHSESLQTELNDVKRRLTVEQQMVDFLQKEKKELEELREELAIARKDIEYHKNNHMNSEKRVHNLNAWIKQLEEEKLNSERKSEKTIGSSQNLKREITDLQSELAEKYNEISELESEICKLKEQLNEKEEGIDHLRKTNELLKHENLALKTSKRRSFSKRNDSPLDYYQTAKSEFDFTSHSDQNNGFNKSKNWVEEYIANDNDNSPSEVFRTSFNSPEFLNQVLHPITPISSPAIDTLHRRKTLGSDDFSPIPQQKENLLKNVLTKHTSTPGQKQGEHVILDSSLPADSRTVPVLAFTQTYCIDNGVNKFLKNDVENMLVSSDLPPPSGSNSSSQPQLNTSLNVSSDEDIYSKLPYLSLSNAEVSGKSLQAEIANATTASLKDKDTKINDLLNRLREHDNCNFIISSYKNEIAQLKVRLAQSEGSLEVCRKCNLLEEEICELKLHIEKITSAKNNLYERLKDELDNGKHLEDVMMAKAELENALQSEKENVNSLQEEVEKHIMQIEDLQAEFEDAKVKYLQEIEELKITVETHSVTISELRCDLQQKNNEMLALNDEISEKDHRESLLATEHNDELDNLNLLIENLQKDVALKDTEINRLLTEFENQNEIKKNLWQNIQDLVAEVTAKEASVSKCIELESSHTDLKSSYTKLEENCKELMGKFDKLQLDYLELEKNYKELSQKCTKFKDANDQLVIVNDELENIQKNQKEAINKLVQEISMCVSNIEICQREKNAYEKELNTVKLEMTKANNENKSLTDEIAELEKRNAVLVEKLDEIQNAHMKELEIITEAMTKADNKNKSLTNEITELGKKNSLLIKKLDDLENGMQSEREVKNNIFKECETLRSQLSEEQNKCSKLKNQLNIIELSLKNTISEKHFPIAKLNEISSSVKDRSMNDVLNQIDVIIETLTADGKVLSDNIKQLRQENEKMKSRIQFVEIQLNKERSHHQNELSSEKFKYNKLQVEYSELKGKYDTSERNLKHNKLKMGAFKKNITVLQQKRDTLCKEKADLQENVTELTETVEKCNTELRGLKSQLEQERKEHNLLKFQLETEIKKLAIENRNLTVSHEDLLRRLKQEEKIFTELREKFMEEKRDLEKKIDKVESKNVSLKRSMADVAAVNNASYKELESAHIEQAKQLADLKYQLECQKLQLIGSTDIMCRASKNISSSRNNLSRLLDTLTVSLKNTYSIPSELLDYESENEAPSFTSPTNSPRGEMTIEKEILKLNKCIKNINSIAEHLASVQSKPVTDAEVQTDFVDNVSSPSLNTQQKPLNKFTLRPSKLILSCPASPDSPSTLGEVLSTDAELIDKVSDAANDSTASTQLLENKDENILYDETKLQPAFPSQPDTFLESLELLEESPRKSLSKSEMEAKFTALVLSWTLDKESIRGRYQRQNSIREEYKKEMIEQLNQVASLLMGHSCPKSVETVVPAVDQLELIKVSLDRVFAVVEQCGVLHYEVRNVKCWNLVINYVASLKQEIDSRKSLSPSIETPRLRKPEVRDAGTGTELRNRKRPKLRMTTQKEEFVCSSGKKNIPAMFFRIRLKKIFFIMIILSFLFIGLTLYVQWLCSRSFQRNAVCPFDFVYDIFCKKTYVGFPPL